MSLLADLLQPVPTWTDKELLITVGSAICAAIPVPYENRLPIKGIIDVDGTWSEWVLT